MPTTVYSQTFDGVTAPAIPAGLTVEAGVVTSTARARSAPNSLLLTATFGSPRNAYTTAQDGNAGDAQAESWFYFNAAVSGGSGQVLCRLTVPPLTTGYRAYILIGTGFQVTKLVSGVNTMLGSAVGAAAFASGIWYRVRLTCNGTSLTAKCQRSSDSQWLNSSGAWQAGETAAITQTDSAITGQGCLGLRGVVASGDAVYADDLVFESLAGGTSYTLTAAAGSFGLTGVAAGLIAARRLTAATGAHVVAGAAAGLRASRVLIATAGGYGLDGRAAGLRASRVLAAASGGFSLDGRAAGLFAARVLTAAAGAIVGTGGDAALTVARRLDAGTGAFGVAGGGADLVVSAPGVSTLMAGTGAFGVAGGAADLVVARRLGAGPGGFALSGADAGLRASRRLGADGVGFAWTGADAALVVAGPGGYTLAAGTGVFVVTGAAAVLVDSGAEPTAPDLLTASWDALGADANLEEAFGVAGWLWLDEAILHADHVGLPYATVAQDLVGEADPPDFDGETAQPVWLRFEVFAGSRDQAQDLARALLARLGLPEDEDEDGGDGDEPPIGPLEWIGGVELYRETDRPDPEPIPAAAGPIYGARVRVKFMTQYNIFGIDA